jgi:hypothetical protein
VYAVGDTVLEAIREGVDFAIEKTPDGMYEVRDDHEDGLSVKLTKPQLLQLIDELKQLAES